MLNPIFLQFSTSPCQLSLLVIIIVVIIVIVPYVTFYVLFLELTLVIDIQGGGID